MKDKLTRKRIRIDYLLVISVLNLEKDFLHFQSLKKRRISLNREARAFCVAKKINASTVYIETVINKGIRTYAEYEKECIRLAQDHSWISED